MAVWESRSIDFKFRIGELTLFKLTRRVLANNIGHEAIWSPQLPDAPAPEQLHGLDGYMLRSAPVAERLPRLLWQNGWIRYVPNQYQRYFTNLSGSFEGYLAKFSAKSRSTLRRKLRKFTESSGGDIQFRVCVTPEEMDAFYADARNISRHTYQEAMFDMGLPTDEGFRQAMQAAAAVGAVRGFLLYHQGQPVAYLYCPMIDGVVQYLYLGYMPEYTQLSVGTVLLLLAFENLFLDPAARYFDFTEGGQDGGLGHKGHFSTESVRCADIYYLRPLRSGWMVALHSGLDRFSAMVGDVLARLGLKANIKKLLRKLKGVG